VGLYGGLFFLSGLTGMVPVLAGNIGANFLSYFFSFGSASYENPVFTDSAIYRTSGLTWVFAGLFCWVLSRHGIRGLLDMTKPWRLATFLFALITGLYCGYRSAIILFILTMAFQFYFEGLCRPRNLAIVAGILIVLGIAVIPNVQKLPFVVQRSISFLPLSINPIVKMDVESSSDWRLRMWQDVLPRVPKYLLLGKGYGYDPEEQYQNNIGIGFGDENDSTLAGDYHNGPLTVLMPFGLAGLVGFIWFLAASMRYLYRNATQGPPELRSINTLLLAFLAARIIVYLLVFGMFPLELPYLAGLMGLSVSLNGSELPEPAKKSSETEANPFEQELAPTEFV
jgi:hypothetical protein